MFRKDSLNRWLGLAIFLVAVLAWFVPAGQAQTVEVTVVVDGVAVPGASLTATANIVIQDGSTFQSISWTQTGGAAASINPAAANPTTVTLAAESVFKDHLFQVISEPPIGPDQLPPTSPHRRKNFPEGFRTGSR